MADDDDKANQFDPKGKGKMRLPRIDSAMNKLPPTTTGGGKGSKDDDKNTKPMKASEESELLDRARKRMERCIASESENRKAALDDLKFKAGEQWDATVMAQRNFDKRPCLTINKLPTFIHQITNEQRQNRPSININPVGKRSDREVAKMLRGMIRAIERDSSADIAYDTAFDGAVSNGFGFFRVLTEYERPDSFDQIITIKRIRNPFTVYLDPDHQEPDGADCRFAFISEMIPREEFKQLYPDAVEMPYTAKGQGDAYKEWSDKDVIRIAEYFEIVNEDRDLVALSNGHTGFKDDLSNEALDMIDAGELDIVKERRAQVPKVKWHKITALEVLETQEWLGQWIPVLKVIGEEVDIEGKVKYSGVIRYAKDPQRMYNYWKTAETELIALAPKAPWIMEEGQVEGHEQQWKQANTRSYPYMLYKGTSIGGKAAPPPQRQPFAGVPQGVVQAAQGSAQDMMATTGIRFDSTMNERMMDESGKAIKELRRTGDIGSFHYVDNLARTLKHLGKILIDLIPKVYDTKRTVTILREDDTEEQVELNPYAASAFTEEMRAGMTKKVKIFNPSVGRYGVTVTVGPSYATKRIEASENMMNFARALPNVAGLIADLIAKNQDWPGAEEMAARLAKAVPVQLLTPDQKDIPPQVQALMQNMDRQIKQLTQERQQLMMALNEKQSDRAVVQDQIDKTFEAKIMKIIADNEIKMAQLQQKTEENIQKHVGSKIEQLAQGVNGVMDTLSKNKEYGPDHTDQSAVSDDLPAEYTGSP